MIAGWLAAMACAAPGCGSEWVRSVRRVLGALHQAAAQELAGGLSHGLLLGDSEAAGRRGGARGGIGSGEGGLEGSSQGHEAQAGWLAASSNTGGLVWTWWAPSGSTRHTKGGVAVSRRQDSLLSGDKGGAADAGSLIAAQ